MRRALLCILGLGLALALSGCFPGQFPAPNERPPPVPQSTGTQSVTPHSYGAPVPSWQSADAAAG